MPYRSSPFFHSRCSLQKSCNFNADAALFRIAADGVQPDLAKTPDGDHVALRRLLVALYAGRVVQLAFSGGDIVRGLAAADGKAGGNI